MRTLKRMEKAEVGTYWFGEGCLEVCSVGLWFSSCWNLSAATDWQKRSSLAPSLVWDSIALFLAIGWEFAKTAEKGECQTKFKGKGWSRLDCGDFVSGVLPVTHLFHLPDRMGRDLCPSWALVPPVSGDSGLPPPFPNARRVNLFSAPIQMSAAVFFL